jgi:uncharacterized protein (TIGR02421 family)
MSGSTKTQQYRQTLRALSDRLVEAQRPIRILDAVKWDAAVREDFFQRGCKELPAVDRSYYESRSLAFDPDEKRAELAQLEGDVRRRLGDFNSIGVIMQRICKEYATVVEMLDARGLPEFSRRSQELYGSAHDVLHAGDPTLAELGALLSDALDQIDRSVVDFEEPRDFSGEQALPLLQERLDRAFDGTGQAVRVMLSDGIISDAAAGSDYIKIRPEAQFSERDLRLMEIHEGWVHLGTTLNGLSQPVCTFLGKGPPSATVTQEGLAILMEILTFASYPARLRKLTNRIRAIAMVESGADFLEVFGFFRDQGFEELECYNNTVRVFRGSTPTGGPFTKDICYSKGFVLTYNYIGLAVRRGLLDRIALLFCGKTTLKDMRVLAQAVEEGLVERPKFLPAQFADLNSLSAWMCYSNFLSRLNLKQIEADYANII